jgi:hypothetical protein
MSEREDGAAEAGVEGAKQAEEAIRGRASTGKARATLLQVARSPLVREGAVAYGCVTVWVLLSSAVIVSNKFVLGPFGFAFPLTLTMWHQLCCTALSSLVVSLSPSLQPLGTRPGLTAPPLVSP